MRSSRMVRMGVLSTAIAAVALAWVPVNGQTAKVPAKDKTWTPPRTPDGHPDLQGVFDFATATPLERPASLAGKQYLTDAEAAEFEKQEGGRRGNSEGAPLPPGQVGGYNQFWYEWGTKVVPDKRTSLIVDPPDGRL